MTYRDKDEDWSSFFVGAKRMWDMSSQPKVPTNRLGISLIKDHHRPQQWFWENFRTDFDLFFPKEGSTATLPGVCIGGPIKNVIIWPSALEDVWNPRRRRSEYISLGIYPFSGYFRPTPSPPCGSWCQLLTVSLFLCVCRPNTIVCKCAA